MMRDADTEEPKAAYTRRPVQKHKRQGPGETVVQDIQQCERHRKGGAVPGAKREGTQKQN